MVGQEARLASFRDRLLGRSGSSIQDNQKDWVSDEEDEQTLVKELDHNCPTMVWRLRRHCQQKLIIKLLGQ